MKSIGLYIAIILLGYSCQSTPSDGNVIVFGDVIGSYEGECADINMSGTLMNREDATLSLIAVSPDIAKVSTTCDRFESYEVDVRSANAEKIIFERTLSNNDVINLTYISQSDSVILTHYTDGSEDLVFSGVRK